MPTSSSVITTEDFYTIVAHVWQTLLHTDLDPDVSTQRWAAASTVPRPRIAEPLGDATSITMVVRFSGALEGYVQVCATRDAATRMARGMLAVTGPEVPAEADVHDVVAELANVLGGNLKSLLAADAKLGLPERVDTPLEPVGQVTQLVVDHLGARTVVTVCGRRPPVTSPTGHP